jgi:hypothetical protein
MDRKLQILLIAGIIITAIVFLFNIYAAGIVLVIFATLVMSWTIMQDSTFLPDIVAELTGDAKAIVIRNSGNALALKIHVALVPENIEFDLPSLGVDEMHIHPLEHMIEQVKVIITFENEKDNRFSRTYQLSGYGDNFDPLKPMIPLFHYK